MIMNNTIIYMKRNITPVGAWLLLSVTLISLKQSALLKNPVQLGLWFHEYNLLLFLLQKSHIQFWKRDKPDKQISVKNKVSKSALSLCRLCYIKNLILHIVALFLCPACHDESTAYACMLGPAGVVSVTVVYTL